MTSGTGTDLAGKPKGENSMFQRRRELKALKLWSVCPARYGEAELPNPISNGE